MKTENTAELKRFRNTISTARSALANLGSPVEHWDHILVDSMELKLSPETAREWDKSLGKSKEFASYEDMYEFLSVCTRSCPGTSDEVDTKARAKSRPSVHSVSVPTCVDCTDSHNLAECEDLDSKSVAQMRW